MLWEVPLSLTTDFDKVKRQNVKPAFHRMYDVNCRLHVNLRGSFSPELWFRAWSRRRPYPQVHQSRSFDPSMADNYRIMDLTKAYGWFDPEERVQLADKVIRDKGSTWYKKRLHQTLSSVHLFPIDIDVAANKWRPGAGCIHLRFKQQSASIPSSLDTRTFSSTLDGWPSGNRDPPPSLIGKWSPYEARPMGQLPRQAPT